MKHLTTISFALLIALGVTSTGWTNGEPVRFRGVPAGYIAISNDGKTFFTSFSFGWVGKYNLQSGEPITWYPTQVNGVDENIYGMSLSKNNDLIATKSGRYGFVIDANSGDTLLIINVDQSSGGEVEFLPSGNQVLMDWQLFDVNTGVEVANFNDGSFSGSCHIAVSSDGTKAVVADWFHAFVCDLVTKKVVAKLPIESECVALSPDGSKILFGGFDYPFFVDTKTLQVVKEIKDFGGSIIRAVAFSPDGSKAFFSNHYGETLIYDTVTDTKITILDTPYHKETPSSSKWERDIAVSLDGNKLVIATGSVAVYDLTDIIGVAATPTPTPTQTKMPATPTPTPTQTPVPPEPTKAPAPNEVIWPIPTQIAGNYRLYEFNESALVPNGWDEIPGGFGDNDAGIIFFADMNTSLSLEQQAESAQRVKITSLTEKIPSSVDGQAIALSVESEQVNLIYALQPVACAGKPVMITMTARATSPDIQITLFALKGDITTGAGVDGSIGMNAVMNAQAFVDGEVTMLLFCQLVEGDTLTPAIQVAGASGLDGPAVVLIDRVEVQVIEPDEPVFIQ
ncbi:MAG: hypothetical protein Q8Q23_04935 [bacterium]|nr:hypothetical protein [bacterium]